MKIRNKGHHVAYVRVSTLDQSLARQTEGMSEFEIDKLFEEKASAKDTKRPQLKECIDYCREGDVLHVHSIDRIARNLKDLQDIIDKLVAKGVSVHFSKEGLIFSGEEDPMGKLMLQMMGAFAEFERSLIRERQREGLAAARKAGKRFGRKKSLSAEQIAEARERVANGEQKSLLAARLGVSRTTLYAALAS